MKPTGLTPAERRLRAQIAANARWSKPGAREAQAEATRASRLARLERQVDPDGLLEPRERAQLAENRLSEEMARLSLRASKARRRE